MFLRYNPTVTFDQTFKPQDTRYRINTFEPNQFQFYIVNGTDSKVYEDQEDYWEFNAWISRWDFINNSEIILGGERIKFTKCQSPKINNSYCFAPDQNLTLSNAFVQFPYTLFYLSIRQCTSGPKCKTKEQIREKLKYSFFKARVPTYFVNSNNYTNPFFTYIKNTESMMTSEFTRRAYYFFTEIQYYSDDGYVFERITKDSKVELSTFYDQTGITSLLSGEKREDIYFES
jgi:hypothetical protein